MSASVPKQIEALILHPPLMVGYISPPMRIQGFTLLILLILVGCSPTPAQVTLPPAPTQVAQTPVPTQVTRTSAPAQGTRTPVPIQVNHTPAPSLPVKLPVIFDDDGSPDGTVALLYLLSDPAVSLQAVVISHGEAHPQVYIQHMGRMLEDFGISGIPLGAGQDSALLPGEDFPEWLRQAADGFWGFPVPNAKKNYPAQEAAKLMVSLLQGAPAPLTIFVSGSSTDLAQALRLDPGIRDHIAAVYMMGGAVYVPGNLVDFSANPNNVSAEWNVYIDPLAASEVLSSGIPVIMVPLDATNQVSVKMEDTKAWRAGGRPADFAADIYDMLLGGSSQKQMPLWDVMTAEIMVHPELCELTPLNIKVITEQGNTYGRTLALADGEPNVKVCLKPDVLGIKKKLAETFGQAH